MKKFSALFIAISLLAASPAAADHVHADKGHEVATIGINGLVCDFCARAMEKTFGKKEAVEKVSVDLTKKTVQLRFRQNQSLDDAAIRKGITDAGYELTNIERKTM